MVCAFLEAHYCTYGYIYLWLPGVEVTDETIFASLYISTLLNFAPRLIGSPVKVSQLGAAKNPALHLRYAKRHGLFHCSEPGYRKTQHRTNVWRQFPGFVGTFDTGLPEITVFVGASIRL